MDGRDDIRRAKAELTAATEPPEAEEMPLAHPVAPWRLGWEGLIYDAETSARLRSVAIRWRNRDHVRVIWGFDRRMSSNGLLCLFTGDPGTGKTAAASAIATELQIPLYRVNVAGLISKYIGETEKNLARILDRAEAQHSALVFDEADAVFSKRTSDVRGSGDLAHNQQIAYLLDRLERWNGLAFLTTNLGSAIDAAFKRRFHVVITFAMPTPELRERIWTLALAQAPVDRDVDLKKLAQAELSGGSIQKVAINAAFAALEDSAPIGMRHLKEALELEMSTMGKLSVF